MQRFTIKDIENLTGIKAHTLRIWEQRYNVFTPKRKESLHRVYDNEDLKQLLHISFLYNSGWKISKIAGLSTSQIRELVKNAAVGEQNYQSFISRLIEAAIDFDEHAFISLLTEIEQTIGFEKCIIDVCYPFLVKVGHLWSTNNVVPAQEHFSSYLIQNKIIVETDKLPAMPGRKPDIILLCPHGEFHELPLLFIHYLLRKSGWGTLYLGSNVRVEDIKTVTNLSQVKFLYLHLLTNFTGFDIDDYLTEICKRFPDKMIVVSGEGIRKSQRDFVNLTRLESDTQIYDFIRKKPENALN